MESVVDVSNERNRLPGRLRPCAGGLIPPRPGESRRRSHRGRWRPCQRDVCRRVRGWRHRRPRLAAAAPRHGADAGRDGGHAGPGCGHRAVRRAWSSVERTVGDCPLERVLRCAVRWVRVAVSAGGGRVGRGSRRALRKEHRMKTRLAAARTRPSGPPDSAGPRGQGNGAVTMRRTTWLTRS